MRKVFDIENAKIFNNKLVVAIVAFFCVCVFYGTKYINDIEAATKHVEGFEDREKYYNSIIIKQTEFNATVENELKYLGGAMRRIEKYIFSQASHTSLASFEETKKKE